MKLKQTTKQTLRRWSGLLVAASLLLASFGCGSGNKQPAAGPVTLTVWMPFDDSESLQPLFQAYQQKHTNVQIVYTKKNIDTYETDLLNALASGSGPDIFAINNAWLPKYIDKATSAPDSIWKFADYKRDFVDAAVNDFTKDQHIYGVPMSVDSLALYYNKDILGSAGIATPPKTWDELSRDVQRVKRQDKTGYFTVSGVAMGTNTNVNRAADILYLLMLQKGAVPFSSDLQNPTFGNTVSVNGDTVNPGFDALSYYTSFATPSSPNYNWNYKSDYSIDSFVNGRSAFLYSYSYTRDTILQKSPNLNFDVAPVPQPDLNQPAVNFANYWGEVVSKQSKNANWAWDLLQFLTSKDSLDKYYAQNKVPSSRRDLIEVQASDPDIGVFANANLTAKSFYRPDQAKMDTIFGKMIDAVILSGLSVDQALSEAEQQAATLTTR